MTLFCCRRHALRGLLYGWFLWAYPVQRILRDILDELYRVGL